MGFSPLDNFYGPENVIFLSPLRGPSRLNTCIFNYKYRPSQVSSPVQSTVQIQHLARRTVKGVMTREYHLHTPQKANRQPKVISDHAKKNQKVHFTIWENTEISVSISHFLSSCVVCDLSVIFDSYWKFISDRQKKLEFRAFFRFRRFVIVSVVEWFNWFLFDPWYFWTYSKRPTARGDGMEYTSFIGYSAELAFMFAIHDIVVFWFSIKKFIKWELN